METDDDLKPYVRLSERDPNWIEKTRRDTGKFDIVAFYFICFSIAIWQFGVGIISVEYSFYFLDALIYFLMGLITYKSKSWLVAVGIFGLVAYNLINVVLMKYFPMPNDVFFPKGDIDNYPIAAFFLAFYAYRTMKAKFKLYRSGQEQIS